jgi:hypothetical protein
MSNGWANNIHLEYFLKEMLNESSQSQRMKLVLSQNIVKLKNKLY